MVVKNIYCGSNRQGVISRNKRVHIIIANCEHTFTRRLHTPQEEFEKGGFTQKAHQMFCIRTTPEESKNVTITCQFGFAFEENIVFPIKGMFSKCFSSTRKRKAGVFKFLQFEEHFQNARARYTDGEEIKLLFKISPAQGGSCLKVLLVITVILKMTDVFETCL